MKRTNVYFWMLIGFYGSFCFGQELEPFELTDAWTAKITAMAPSKTTVPATKNRNILIFSLHTGYEHWTIPHTETVMRTVAEKSGAFKVSSSNKITAFEAENLAKFDAVILNNNCSERDKRDLFWDIIKKDSSLTETQQLKKAQQFQQNLLDYVTTGGGLFVLHGGITMLNKSEAFGKMVGGSFDYHPVQQKVTVKTVDAEHPLTKAFKGIDFEHVDEPYFFNNAYFNTDFHPLLYMEADAITEKKEGTSTDNICYVSWVKRYGQGRVFYASPSHNPQSYEHEGMLQFLLDGLQYVCGDLVCDDTPLKN
ncbi:ThuA domain-containing protein [Maribacter sp. 2-571]|uniref:ThuA domain-containing protein n=1 Tax=Maribacter sp. 2-571 TaxID=3417569 RepID=UPI003D352517